MTSKWNCDNRLLLARSTRQLVPFLNFLRREHLRLPLLQYRVPLWPQDCERGTKQVRQQVGQATGRSGQKRRWQERTHEVARRTGNRPCREGHAIQLPNSSEFRDHGCLKHSRRRSRVDALVHPCRRAGLTCTFRLHPNIISHSIRTDS